MKYGLIGEHLGHSFSKEVHAMLSDYNYEILEIAPEELDGSLVHKVYFTGTEEEYKALRRNNLKYENGLPYMAVYDYVIEE